MNTSIKNMNDLVSVIIPAYNAATRIKLTLESIIAQDYPDIEIIIVDDVSTDGTGDIAREVLKVSGRDFMIISHEHNGGECASRNTGLKHANGKYICFVDADDMIRENFVSSLHAAITRDKCEISFCGFVNRYTDGRKDNNFHAVRSKPATSSGEKFIVNNSVPSVWCCMYEHDFLKKYSLSFSEGCTAGGDIEFITKALCRAEKVTSIKEYLYIYVHHAEMGSVRDNDTGQKKLLRYEHNTGAQFRTAEYIMKHAGSERLKIFAEKVLLPQSVIRTFGIYAAKNDIEHYHDAQHDERTRSVLHRALSFYTFTRKTEIFMKALMILHFPKIYYGMRAKLSWR